MQCMTIFIIGGVTFEKILITVVIILLIGALGFAIYAAINHSTSSIHNNEQDNKATHQKKDTEVNHQKDENTNNTNENQNNNNGVTNGNQSSTPSTVQNNGSTAPANTQPSNPNQSNSNQSSSNHGGSSQPSTNNQNHKQQNTPAPNKSNNANTNESSKQVSPSQPQSSKINHLPDTSTSIRYIIQKNSNEIFFYLKYLTAVLYLHNSHSVKFI